jgi:outer membrane lipoprotein SlyB
MSWRETLLRLKILNKVSFLFFLLSLIVLPSCSYNSLRPDVVDRNQAQRMQTVRFGTVESVDKIVIAGDRKRGALAGAAIGAASGSSISDSDIESGIGAVLGGLVGSAVGSAVGDAATRKDAIELLVALDDGKTVSIIQEASDDLFEKGIRVKVITSAGKTRVLPAE